MSVRREFSIAGPVDLDFRFSSRVHSPHLQCILPILRPQEFGPSHRKMESVRRPIPDSHHPVMPWPDLHLSSRTIGRGHKYCGAFSCETPVDDALAIRRPNGTI